MVLTLIKDIENCRGRGGGLDSSLQLAWFSAFTHSSLIAPTNTWIFVEEGIKRKSKKLLIAFDSLPFEI